MENSFHFFPLWKRGMKGDLTAFQKAKVLPLFLFIQNPVVFRGDGLQKDASVKKRVAGEGKYIGQGRNFS
jgi:hypothetical protein